MGSPVSAVVANLYMEFFEGLALTSAPLRPRVWKRYVDDTFCICKRGSEEEFLHHLNSIRTSIQFTMECEEDRSLAFLDCHLSRKNNGRLEASVYRKPTHTDRYLQFQSHHPVHVRRGVIRSLYDRARRVNTNEEKLEVEERHLGNVFRRNGYPASFMQATLKHTTSEKRSGNSTQSEEEEEKEPMMVVPYISGLSEDIRRVCWKFGIRTVFRSSMTLRDHLTRVKDRLPDMFQSRVVYRIPCSCGKFYIGETIRRLETRMKEHKDACEKGLTERSAVAEHAWNEHHPIEWKAAAIVDKAKGRKELALKEALHIQLTPKEQRFNRDVGVELPVCWVATIRALRRSLSPTTRPRLPRGHD